MGSNTVIFAVLKVCTHAENSVVLGICI